MADSSASSGGAAALGELLRGWRERALLTQEQLAQRAGLSVRTICRLETGRLRRPRDESLRLLADALALGDLDRRALTGAARGEPVRPAAGVARGPRQLPADIAGFTGRAGEARELDELLAAGAAAAVGAVLSGPPGVGKTALAVHWAHRVAERFPDGHLYVNLRGFDPTGSPVAAVEAVRWFLDAFDVPPERIPASLDAQAALYRSLLAGRRVLVLLDNARDPEQVRPLLPGSPGCLVVLTSRSPLTGLVAGHGMHPITLDLLPAADARMLLANRIGADRTTTEPAAVAEIVTRCARLPLALAVVAARAATHPHFPLHALAAELRETRGRLDAFTGDDAATDVRAVFSWSLRTLSPAAAGLFRLLSRHPGPDLTVPAAASLAGRPAGQVQPLLAELARAHLVSEPVPGRYACHDLLRALAGELAGAQDPAAELRAATHRLLDHYLHTAFAGDRLLGPRRAPIQLAPPQPGVVPEPLTEHSGALAWFAAEHAVLLGTVRLAADAGFPAHAWQLPWTMAHFLAWRGHWHDLAATQAAAIAAATQLGDPLGQAHAHGGMAGAHCRLRRPAEAYRHYQRALELFEQLGHGGGRATTHRNLAHVLELQGRPAEALDHALRALELRRGDGDLASQADALNSIGWLHAQLGDYRQAVSYCERSLALHEETGDRAGAAAAWDSLGYAHQHLGHHTRATACYQRALDLFRSIGDRYNEADILSHLGDNERAAGAVGAARAAWRQAAEILTELRHPAAEAVRTKLLALSPAAAGARPAPEAGTG